MLRKLVRPLGQALIAFAIGSAVPDLGVLEWGQQHIVTPLYEGAGFAGVGFGVADSAAPALELVGTPGPLASGYRLPVMLDVPEPPEDARGEAPPPSCPLTVRAIVSGEDGFVVVMVNDSRHTLRAGERVNTPSGAAHVIKISAKHVTVRLTSGDTVSCTLER